MKAYWVKIIILQRCIIAWTTVDITHDVMQNTKSKRTIKSNIMYAKYVPP